MVIQPSGLLSKINIDLVPTHRDSAVKNMRRCVSADKSFCYFLQIEIYNEKI